MAFGFDNFAKDIVKVVKEAPPSLVEAIRQVADTEEVGQVVSDAADVLGVKGKDLDEVGDALRNASRSQVDAIGNIVGISSASIDSIASLPLNFAQILETGLEVVTLLQFQEEEEEFIKSHEKQEPEDRDRSGAKSQSLKKAFCLIQAPKNIKGRSYEFDEMVRAQQYEGFCQLHPLLKPPVSNDVHCEIKSVNSSESMMQTTEQFLEQQASNAIIAVLIFNGHGNKNGMLFEEGEPLALDIFLNDCVKLFRECQAQHQGFPRRLEVVFAQCYGHLYKEREEEEDLLVVCFTNEKKKFSIQLVRPNKDKALQSCNHVDLEEYAKKENDD